jgi:DNA-binding NarL/FixJ family response regulator/signal transduction histidine kinase/PAS domain-containing protein
MPDHLQLAAVAVREPRTTLLDLVSALHADQSLEGVAVAATQGIRLLAGANTTALFLPDQDAYRCCAISSDAQEAAGSGPGWLKSTSAVVRELSSTRQAVCLAPSPQSPLWQDLRPVLSAVDEAGWWKIWPLCAGKTFLGFVTASFSRMEEGEPVDSSELLRFIEETVAALRTASLLGEQAAQITRATQLLDLSRSVQRATQTREVTALAVEVLGPALGATVAFAAIERHGALHVDASYTVGGTGVTRDLLLALQPILQQSLVLRRSMEGQWLQAPGEPREDVVRARVHALLQAGVRNLLVVPLVQGEEHLGVLAFANGDTEHTWKPGDRSLVEQAAALLAEALKQLREREHVARRGAEHEAERRLLRAVVDRVPVGIVVDEPLGAPVVLNTAARQFARASQGGSDELRFDAYRQDGSPVAPDDLPREQAQRSSSTSLTANLLLRRHDGKLVNAVWQIMPLHDEQGHELGTLSLVRDVTSYREAEQIAEERQQQMVTYEAIVREILAAPTIGEALSAIVPHLRLLLPYDGLSIGMLDGLKESMHRVAAVGSLPRLFADDETIALSQSIGQQVIETGEAQIYPDLSEVEAEEARVAADAGVHGCMVVPILVERRAIGTLNLLSRQPGVYDQQHLAIASQLALLVGNAIEQDRRADAIRREAVDEERERLAREIHDTLAQTITGLVMQLDLVFRGLQGDSVLRGRVEQARSIARTALNEARRTVWNLRTGSADLSNVHALFQEECMQLEQLAAIHPDIIMVGEQRAVAPEIGSVLQRLARVTLENVRAHSHAKQVRILIEFESQRLRVTIEDNGQGFDPEKVDIEGQSRVGLAGATERVRHVGGSLRIESATGHGTRVIAELPYAPAEPTILTSHPGTAAASIVPAELTGPVTRILLIDDHTMVRQGLERMLQDQPDLMVIGSEATGADGLRRIAELQPDVVLCDLQLPDMSGVEVIAKTRTHFPQVKCLVVTTYDSDDYIYEGIKAGAKGYVLKDVSSDELVKAVRAAAQGESLLQPVVAKRLVEKFADMARQDGAVEALTEREVEVLKALASGARNKEIAFDLGLSESTIKTHLASIFGKLSVTTRTEAVARGRELGLLSL